MPTHLAMLRGVNLGKRQVFMAQLRKLLEGLGHADVSTYVQSGNAVWDALCHPKADVPQRKPDGVNLCLDAGQRGGSMTLDFMTGERGRPDTLTLGQSSERPEDHRYCSGQQLPVSLNSTY